MSIKWYDRIALRFIRGSWWQDWGGHGSNVAVFVKLYRGKFYVLKEKKLS